MSNPYIIGPPVRLPANFYGRVRQAKQFFEHLAGPQGQCFSILGVRRAGKTSFLQYVAHPQVKAAHLPNPERFLMVYVDVSACRSATEFYTRVHQRLLDELPGALRPERKSPPADAYMVESLLYEFEGRRVVVLMDEFDHLRTARFSGDFLVELRALTSDWNYDLAYVTASYWNLVQLGNLVGLPPTSPFYNIFYPTPIYLSGLSATELDELVRLPARRVGIEATGEDVAYVRSLAGSLPFFVQATAAIWLQYKVEGRKRDTRMITQRLVSEMWPYYEQWWRNFSDIERDVLATISKENQSAHLPYDEGEINATVEGLWNYGLIAKSGTQFWMDSQVFSQWIREISGRARQVAVPLKDAKQEIKAAAGVANGAYPAEGRTPGAGPDESQWSSLMATVQEVCRRFERSAAETGVADETELRDQVASAIKDYVGHSTSGTAMLYRETGEFLVRPDGTSCYGVLCARWAGQSSFLGSVDALLRRLSGSDTGATIVLLARATELPHIAQAVAGAIGQHTGYAGVDGRHGRQRFDYRLIRGQETSPNTTTFSILLCAVPG